MIRSATDSEIAETVVFEYASEPPPTPLARTIATPSPPGIREAAAAGERHLV